MKLQGKTALVTGAAVGIGAAIAQRFVQEGARVCINDLRQEALHRMARTLPSGTVATCVGDVSKVEDAARMVQATVGFGGKIDILVNNAATTQQGGAGDADRTVWRRVLEVNLAGPFLLMQEAIPHMIESGGGSIINIASVGGMRCLPNMSAYCTSKAGLIMLTQQAALDYGRHKIRCNAVCPGMIHTDLVEEEWGDLGRSLGMDPAAFFASISADLPLQRLGKPDEIAGICVYLAGDDSSFMTGAAILVDAGTVIVDVVGASITAALRRGGIPQ
jgi:NAD(P)-dependent dehydrogenase (short-subunit alcohol dehydrogenase family)